MKSAVAAAVLLVIGANGRGAETELQRFAYEKAEMGLPFRITLYAADEAAARDAADAAFARIAELNASLSDYDPDSELSRLSRTSGSGKAVPVSRDLWLILECSQQLAQATNGAFDVTVGPVISLWRRARRKQELPSPEMIAEMRARVGFRHLNLDPVAKTATLDVPDMRLDLGAIAKGYAVDEALAVLKARGLSRALVGGSGDMAAGDPPPGQRGWSVEVAALDVPDAPPAQTVYLANSALATSGDVFQRLEIAGQRYSHIIDPRTGSGLTDHSLVTILAQNCFTADRLATAVSVLGPEAGLALIEATPDTAAHLVRKPVEKIEFLESSQWKRLSGR